jgi:hypothetical protein
MDAARREASMSPTLIVETRGVDAAEVLGGVASCQLVDETTLESGWTRCRCLAPREAHESVVAALLDAGGGVRELRGADVSLEAWVHSILQGGAA